VLFIVDLKHSLPVAEMGNYVSKMNAREILRNPLESEQEIRQRELTIFGNPYRKVESSPHAIGSWGSGVAPSEDGSSPDGSISSRISSSSFSSVRSISSFTSMKSARLRSTSPSMDYQASTSTSDRVIHRVAPLNDFTSRRDSIIPHVEESSEFLEARRLLESLDIVDRRDEERTPDPQTPPGRWVKDIDEHSIMEEVEYANHSPPPVSSHLDHGDGSDMVLPYERMREEPEEEDETPTKKMKFDEDEVVEWGSLASELVLVDVDMDDDGDSSGTTQGPTIFAFTNEAEALTIAYELVRRTPRGKFFS
jgi:hypothetical protein